MTPEEKVRLESLPTENTVAYDLYLRSTELRAEIPEENATAVELLRQATHLDPGFALAYAQMAWCFNYQWVVHGKPSAGDSARTQARRAIELDPEIPDAYTALGFALGYDGAPYYRRAVEINPSDAWGWALLGATGWWTGDHVNGAIAARRGVRVAPNDWLPAYHLGWCLALLGMYEKAAQWYERAVEIDPREFFSAQALAWVYRAQGDTEGAKPYLQPMVDVGGANASALYTVAFNDLVAGDLGSARGNLAQAARINPRQASNGLPVAEVILGWVLSELGSPEGPRELERLESVRLRELEEKLEGLETDEAEQIPAAQALSLSGTYNDLTVISSGLGKLEEQSKWFLKAAELDRMNLFYHTLRFAPWVEEIADRPEVRRWMQEKEQQMAIQRRELEALGPWTPDGIRERSP
jgi:tetratricopeptide (TPR) repeat protein